MDVNVAKLLSTRRAPALTVLKADGREARCIELFVFHRSRHIHLGQNRDIQVTQKIMAYFIASSPGAKTI